MNKALVIKEEDGRKVIQLYGCNSVEEFAKEIIECLDNNVDCYLVK